MPTIEEIDLISTKLRDQELELEKLANSERKKKHETSK